MHSATVLLSSVVLASFVLQLAEGHGEVLKPYSWSDAGGKWVPGMENPCPLVTGVGKIEGRDGNTTEVIQDFITAPANWSMACYWYTNYTEIPGEITLDPSMRTFPQLEEYGDTFFDKNPWMSPGSAPIFTPCGLLGGNPLGPGSPIEFFPNAGWRGPSAEDYYMSPGFPDVVSTDWKAGSVVETAWAMTANHGGGYSYRPGRILAIRPYLYI